MASFSFNFSLDSATPAASVVETKPQKNNAKIDVPKAFIMPLDNHEEHVDIQIPSSTIQVPIAGKQNPVSFLRVDADRVTISEELSSALQNAKGASDLVSGVYEGGLRVWEGSLDLIAYMHTHRNIVQADTNEKKGNKKNKGGNKKKNKGNKALRCLELGCGHGLPGIYVLKSPRTWSVCFSDFNDEVLKK
jgi:hypothetical protein